MSDEQIKKIKDYLNKINTMSEKEIDDIYKSVEEHETFHEISKTLNPSWECKLEKCSFCAKA